MGHSPSEAVVHAWALLMKAQRVALEQVERELRGSKLPPLAWYDVLLELERAEPEGMRPFELEQHLLLAQYNLSRLLERLERAGYVQRRDCEEDGRGHRLRVTAAGRAIRRRMWPVYGEAIEKAIGSRLSTKRAEQLAELLGEVLSGLSVPSARGGG
jgi:DNA-binding MarR family transcriptional regulator